MELSLVAGSCGPGSKKCRKPNYNRRMMNCKQPNILFCSRISFQNGMQRTSCLLLQNVPQNIKILKEYSIHISVTYCTDRAHAHTQQSKEKITLNYKHLTVSCLTITVLFSSRRILKAWNYCDCKEYGLTTRGVSMLLVCYFLHNLSPHKNSYIDDNLLKCDVV
jgi:hypothetical protein